MSTQLILQAGDILGEAFLDYPVMEYAFTKVHGQERQKLLAALYTKLADVAMEEGNVIVTEYNTGAICWVPRSSYRVIFNRKILAIPFLVGIVPTWRMARHSDETEEWIEKHTAQNFGYISCVGVLASGRGKGHCRALIKQCLDEMKQKGMTECWLMTDKEINVTIYTKLGFHVELEHVVKCSGLKSWAMKIDI
ncbi:hypothetical protein THRCLA_21360 [Thraustotheca clavata]|uniref:N-acetyltransferase domain-containing protein n=1 Tax=Thraustotheca clavata TaxID=74557 RepID=A0A1V9ZXF0_9STRA|nr:hypothetical protein THRCLA_21360 [Thraustotheca clavata]